MTMVVQQARNDAAVGHRIHTFCTPGNLMILENIRHVFFLAALESPRERSHKKEWQLKTVELPGKDSFAMT